MVFDLLPRYSYRKSFYGKAQVIEEDNIVKLKSYSTIVAEVKMLKEKTIYRYLGHYSMTTTSHQNEFFKQYGLNDKQIKKLYKEGVLEIKQ